MAVEVGEKYYFAVHAYHHFVARVAAVTGRKEIVTGRCLRVQSCQRGWTEFFQDGFQDDTVYTVWPDGTELSGWYIAAPWRHEIPGETSDAANEHT